MNKITHKQEGLINIALVDIHYEGSGGEYAINEIVEDILNDWSEIEIADLLKENVPGLDIIASDKTYIIKYSGKEQTIVEEFKKQMYNILKREIKNKNFSHVILDQLNATCTRWNNTENLIK